MQITALFLFAFSCASAVLAAPFGGMSARDDPPIDAFNIILHLHTPAILVTERCLDSSVSENCQSMYINGDGTSGNVKGYCQIASNQGPEYVSSVYKDDGGVNHIGFIDTKYIRRELASEQPPPYC